ASLMKMLASELETNTTIRVNSVDPGPVRTRLRMVAYPALDRSSWVEPDAILAPYLYLLGPDSRGVTGQCLQAQD
ncbi:MAG: SDR family oxidoreductase, partial [Candidatus Competibacteraceae bacterium]|nr:SDR family oxidoreductase [Candidatus Competibacteraceae bacterium]